MTGAKGPHVSVPDEAIVEGVVDMELVQRHHWPALDSALKGYVAALSGAALEPYLRELVRIRSARITGCTY